MAFESVSLLPIKPRALIASPGGCTLEEEPLRLVPLLCYCSQLEHNHAGSQVQFVKSSLFSCFQLVALLHIGCWEPFVRRYFAF
jgi:hypothetical protein